jgi:hypothetical protein
MAPKPTIHNKKANRELVMDIATGAISAFLLVLLVLLMPK